MGKREGILVCSGGVTGPDRPWLKEEDKTVNKWKISGAVLQAMNVLLKYLSLPTFFNLYIQY